MPETFRIRVASRRQVTLPTRVLELLHVDEGDVLEISIDKSKSMICGGKGLKLVPAGLFDTELLERLQEREKQIAHGLTIEAKNTQDLVEKVRRKPVNIAAID